MLNVLSVWHLFGSVWHYRHPLKRAQHNPECLTGRFLWGSVHRESSFDFCISGDHRWQQPVSMIGSTTQAVLAGRMLPSVESK